MLLVLVCLVALNLRLGANSSFVNLDPSINLMCDSDDVFDKEFWASLEHIGADNMFSYFRTQKISQRSRVSYDYVQFPTQTLAVKYPITIDVGADSISKLNDAFLMAQERTPLTAAASGTSYSCKYGGIITCTTNVIVTIGQTEYMSVVRDAMYFESTFSTLSTTCRYSCFEKPSLVPIVMEPKDVIEFILPDGMVRFVSGPKAEQSTFATNARGLCWVPVHLHSEVLKLRQLNLEGIVEGVSASSYSNPTLPSNRVKRGIRDAIAILKVKVRRFITKLFPILKQVASETAKSVLSEIKDAAVTSLTERKKRQIVDTTPTGSSYIDNFDVYSYNAPYIRSASVSVPSFTGVIAVLLNNTIGETERAKILYYSSWYYSDYSLEKSIDYTKSDDCAVGFLGSYMISSRKGSGTAFLAHAGACGDVGCAVRKNQCSGTTEGVSGAIPESMRDLLEFCDDSVCPTRFEERIAYNILNGVYRANIQKKLQDLKDHVQFRDGMEASIVITTIVNAINIIGIVFSSLKK